MSFQPRDSRARSERNQLWGPPNSWHQGELQLIDKLLGQQLGSQLGSPKQEQTLKTGRHQGLRPGLEA